jgi:hypothetical protein
MIVFDLQCEQKHVFEIWFGSTSDYEDQRARKLVSCPYCGSTTVEKALMAPRLSKKSNQQLVPVVSQEPTAQSQSAPTPEQVKQALQALAAAQAKALEGSSYVGMRFVDEARAMHDGEIDQRPIHGHASPDEAKALIEEGVAVAPLPFPILPPDSVN